MKIKIFNSKDFADTKTMQTSINTFIDKKVYAIESTNQTENLTNTIQKHNNGQIIKNKEGEPVLVPHTDTLITLTYTPKNPNDTE